MSSTIQLTLPDQSVIEAPSQSTVYDIVGRIGSGLQKSALAARVNNEPKDLTATVTEDATLSVITPDTEEGKDILWHSASHLMAQAVKRLFPEAQVTIGPSVETGFYYDFDIPRALTPDDLAAIEAEMEKIVKEDMPVQREEMSRQKAIELFQDMNETYKVELLSEMEDGTVSLYRQGDFIDLCRGPHVTSTGKIRAFKLLSVAGAYWRGDERNRMLQRIYGVAFTDKKELKRHLAMLEEAKKRDHRRLGKELDLYSTHEEAGGGLIYWHPKGARIRAILEEWWRQEHFKNGYEILYTPHIGRSNLWETSGHLDFYSEGMFSPMDIDGNDYYIKPMNCPFHIKVYQTDLRSYRDLPMRWAELGTVYRYEKSGVLHGLLRVRGFTQDDAHIFCTPDQMESEVREVLRFSLYMWKTLGFSEIKAYLATRPEKSVGEQERWEDAQRSLRKAVEAENLSVELDEGGGAFYGPKIDLKVRDSIGREWQMSTIQFDFNLPERFDMHYVGEDGRKHRPYMIHRALLGSLERFFGILVEHYGGRFPLWFAPEQVRVINVSDAQLEYVKEVAARLRKAGFRPGTDIRDESMGYRVREAINAKVPWICVAGAEEAGKDSLSVRRHGEKEAVSMTLDEFMAQMAKEVEEKGQASS